MTNVHAPLVTLTGAPRMTKRQGEILNCLSWETPHLVSYYLTEGGLPFDFRSIYFRLTGRFDYASVGAGSIRRTLRSMEGKGILRRGTMLTDVADHPQLENIQPVATWHMPELFERDCKFMAALPDIAIVKRQKVTEETPGKYITTVLGGIKMVGNTWLEKPLIDWLDGRTPAIELPAWVRVPGTCHTAKQLQHE